MEYLHNYKTESEFLNDYNGDNYKEPWISYTKDEPKRVDYNKEHIDYSKLPLTFEILSDGNIIWRSMLNDYKRTIQYSKNDGDWISITSKTGTTGASISVLAGDIVRFKGNNLQYSYNTTKSVFFYSGASRKVYGNIMSLLYGDEFEDAVEMPCGFTFYSLFSNCYGLVDIENLILPATGATQYCYNNMFQGCSALVTTPKILPATTLGLACYGNMFANCSKITKAPILPAKTLEDGCYSTMFSGCSALNNITCLATDISASNCTKDWLLGVQNKGGVFYKDPAMSSWPSGTSGILTNWTVQDAS